MRVLVIFPGALGDLCLLASALAPLVARGDAVEMSVQRGLEPVVTALLANVRLGPPIDGASMASLFAETLAAELRAWLRGADRVHAWLARSASADRVRAHLSAASGGTAALHAVPRDDGERHAVQEYRAALDVAALPPAALATSIPAPTVWRATPAARLLVHPGAGARAKCWARDGFRIVADAWRSEGGEVIVLLGPAEADDTAYWTGSGHRVLTDVALDEVVAVMVGAAHFVGNDSGVSHLAGALERRGVVLFGPTRPERWQPIGGALVPVRFSGRAIADVAGEVRTALASQSSGLLP